MKKVLATCFLLTTLLFTMTACGSKCRCDESCVDKISDVSQVILTDTPAWSLQVKTPSPTETAQSSYTIESKCSEDYDQILYDEVKDYYLSGEWDGRKTSFRDHIVELSSSRGYVLSDGYILEETENLDLPDDFDFEDTDSSYEYVQGKGTYVIINHKLVKYVRGTEFSLPGEELSWKGDYYSDGDVRLVYNFPGKTLYLLTMNPKYEIEDIFNGEFLVYVFPDYNKSEIEYLGTIRYDDVYEGAEWVNFERMVENNK